MKKIKTVLIAPDSFKGTLEASEFCEVAAGAIYRLSPSTEIIARPLADGGEGTAAILASNWGGKLEYLDVAGPYFHKVRGFYGRAEAKAVIEMACCAGLPLVKDNLNPGLTTTYGVGELIAAALEQGAREILLCLGGSCTNDGGCGMMAALGVKFFRADGSAFIPVGNSLREIARISVAELHPGIKETKFKIMCDVENPLFGPRGAAYVFAPQKGADEEAVKRLDEGLRHLAAAVNRDLGCRDCEFLPGTGAAGGMGYAGKVFLQGELLPGIKIVMDSIGLPKLIAKADLVITGEGKLDRQSLAGKVISGLGKSCQKYGKPLIAVVGGLELKAEDLRQTGVTAAFSINKLPVDFAVSKNYTKENLEDFIVNLWQVLNIDN